MLNVGVGEQKISPGLMKHFEAMSSISSEPLPTMTSSGLMPYSEDSLALKASEFSLGYAHILVKSNVSATSRTAGLTPNRLALSFSSIMSLFEIEYDGLVTASRVFRLSSPIEVISASSCRACPLHQR